MPTKNYGKSVSVSVSTSPVNVQIVQITGGAIIIKSAAASVVGPVTLAIQKILDKTVQMTST